jgi:protein-tyrosine phosphatase
MLPDVFQKVAKRLRVLAALRRALRDSDARLQQTQPRRVLVLCYGNIYRSPLVAVLLKDRLGQDVEIRSAGFHHKANRPSPEDHVAMAARYNIDLSKHESTVISHKLVQWADLIIIMDRHNWYALADFARDAIDKTVWLGAMREGESVEITDPYGETPEHAEAIVQQLIGATEALAARLQRK